MRRRRKRTIVVIHDKAWHDAQMAKGFQGRVSWEALKARCEGDMLPYDLMIEKAQHDPVAKLLVKYVQEHNT